MGRKKGSEKTGGRKKGTPNKTTQTAKEWISETLCANWEQMKSDLQSLEPKERLQLLFIFKLLEYVVPKQRETSTNVKFEDLTEEEMDELANKLTNCIPDQNQIK